jgi:hypothetical protein
LLTFATFFFGGGYLTLSVWVVLVGLGLYVHGLFSEQLLEWVGALIILIGIVMAACRLDYTHMQWISASTLGLGLPLLSFMLDHGRERAVRVRLLQSAGWLLCVLIPPLLASRLGAHEMVPDVPAVSFEQYRLQPGLRQAVTLPAGMTIPVKVDISGNLFQPGKEATFPLVLNEPLQVMMDDGKPTGELRTLGGDWIRWRDTLTIQIPRITAAYDPKDGAEIRSSLIIKTRQSSR